MGAIRRKEKNHGIEESNQKSQEGQKDSAGEEPYYPQGWWIKLT
jgi:hypothetical protein